MSPAPRHHCHAIGCPVQVPPRMFSCRPHWYRTPKALQTLIWRYYREGQEIDKRPSTSYLAVQQLTVAYLAWLDAERAREPKDIAHLRREGALALSNARNWCRVSPPEVESACAEAWGGARRPAWPVWRAEESGAGAGGGADYEWGPGNA